MRIPESYRGTFNQTEIIKGLKTKSYNEARKLCKLVTSETLKLFGALKLGLFDEEQEKSMINKYILKVLDKQTAVNENTTTKVNTIVANEPKKDNGKKLSEIIDIYLKNISVDTSQAQKKAYESFFNNIFLELFDKDSSIENIDREKLLEIREIIKGLPKRNIQKYRKMKLSKLLQTQNIKDEDKIAIKTVNDYLKWIMSLFSFTFKYGYLKFNPAIELKYKVKANAKEQREIFEDDELKKFVELNKNEADIKLFHQTLFYTGMINSEFLQAKIKSVDGVLCFDLTNPNLKLKTLARYRLIPINSHLIQLGIVERLEFMQKTYTSDFLSKRSNEFIKEHISNSRKKVLYSFRHTFATKLQNELIDESIIAQLMGHTKVGMTFGRYAKGYVAQTLKNAIETLKYPNS